MNNYYIIGIATLIVLVLSFYYFTKSENWDSSRYILSADTEGNLKPISESYFEDEEKRYMAIADQKASAAEIKSRYMWVRADGCIGGPNPHDQHRFCHHSSWVGSTTPCSSKVKCPPGTVARPLRDWPDSSYCGCTAMISP